MATWNSTVNSVADVEEKDKVFMYSKVKLSLENCILPPEKLSPTPSSLDGLEKDVEIELRILGCELIQTSGLLLRLPQVAMATGQVLFQRFFYSKSFVRHSMEIVAMACVTLASKIQEAPRRIRDVINVFHHIKQVKTGKTIQPLIIDQNYINLKNQVIKAERRVLKELGFSVHVKHPHKMIVTLLEVLEKVNNKRLLQTAWNYMTDSLRSEVFLRYNPEAIACACIYLSARVLQIPLPNKPAWYLVFDVTEDEIHSICHIILNLYTHKKPDPDRLEKTVDEVKKVHQEAKLKAKGILNASSLMTNHHSFSPTSNPSSPKSNKSPNVEIKKEKDLKVNNGVSPKEMNHRKRRSLSPMDDSVSPRRKKKSKTSSSGSQSSHSPSPRHKHGKTPPRGYKESHRSRSRSKTRDSSKKSKHRSSHKTHKRSRSRSESASPLSRKHSSKKSYKSKSSKSRHISKSPPRIYEHNHHHHMNSQEKSHKSSRKEKSNHHSKEKSRR